MRAENNNKRRGHETRMISPGEPGGASRVWIQGKSNAYVSSRNNICGRSGASYRALRCGHCRWLPRTGPSIAELSGIIESIFVALTEELSAVRNALNAQALLDGAGARGYGHEPVELVENRHEKRGSLHVSLEPLQQTQGAARFGSYEPI